jgi:spermidine synthase
MGWAFFKNSTRRSKHNGLILTTSQGEVWAFGTKQTSLRYGQMWADALARTGQADIKNVLMLGLAGGGALGAIHSAYPDAAVVAVEYDEAMVEVARDLLKDAPFALPKIIVADAQEALTNLEERFDLILVDIFVGARPSPLVGEEAFWNAVKARLTPSGGVVLNVAGDSTRVYDPQKYFGTSKVWQWSANTFCYLA